MTEVAIPKIFMQSAVLAALFFICFCVFEIYTAHEDIYYAIANVAEEISDAHASVLVHYATVEPPGLSPQNHRGRSAMVEPVPPEGGYNGPGPAGPAFSFEGYTGPGPALATVTQALSMEDNAWIALKGAISRSLGGKEYLFADSTGTIEAHIGPMEWMGQRINAADTVEIHGYIHKDRRRSNTHIHVKGIMKR